MTKELSLTFEPQGKQSEAIKAWFDPKITSCAYGGGGGGGKSYLSAFLLWISCMKYEGSRWFMARRVLKELKQTTLVSYWEFCNDYNIPKRQQGHYSEQKSNIVFENGSEIVLLEMAYKPSDRLGRRFGSMLFTGGVIDESYEINYDYIDVLYSRVGRWKNAEYRFSPTILELFNPDKGHVHRRFYKPFVEGSLKPHVKFIPALAIDRLKHSDYFKKNKVLHSEDEGTSAGIYVTALLKRSESIQRRILWGDFNYDDSPDKLLNIDQIYNLFKTPKLLPSNPIRCATLDVAFSNDRLVLLIWNDGFLIDALIRDNKGEGRIGGKVLVEIVGDYLNKWNIPEENFIYDAVGVGEFIGQDGGFFPLAKPFKSNFKPNFIKNSKEQYTNLKSWAAHNFAEKAKKGYYSLYALMTNPKWKEDTIAELEQLKEPHRGDDTKARDIIKKEEMKVLLGGRSPDILDALIMREYVEEIIKLKWSGDAY